MTKNDRWTTLRDELAQRREARAAERRLREDLANYRTPTDIEDLLAAVGRDDSADAQVVRDVLMRYLAVY